MLLTYRTGQLPQVWLKNLAGAGLGRMCEKWPDAGAGIWYIPSMLVFTVVTYFLQRVSIACYAERCISYSKSVRLSVRHTLALSQNDSSYDHGVFTGG